MFSAFLRKTHFFSGRIPEPIRKISMSKKQNYQNLMKHKKINKKKIALFIGGQYGSTEKGYTHFLYLKILYS